MREKSPRRQEVETTLHKLEEYLKGFEEGLDLRLSGVSFNDDYIRVNLKLFSKTVIVNPTEENIKRGVAKHGTVVKYGSRVAKIIDVKRKNYVVEFSDKPGKYFIVPFHACELSNPIKIQEDGSFGNANI